MTGEVISNLTEEEKGLLLEVTLPAYNLVFDVKEDVQDKRNHQRQTVPYLCIIFECLQFQRKRNFRKKTGRKEYKRQHISWQRGTELHGLPKTSSSHAE